MKKEQQRQTRSYDRTYKAQAVQLALEIGAKQASIELGVPLETIANWATQARKGEVDTGPGSQTPAGALTQAGEIQRLREELRAANKRIKRLEEENAFLEDASAFFAASRQKLARKSDSNT